MASTPPHGPRRADGPDGKPTMLTRMPEDSSPDRTRHDDSSQETSSGRGTARVRGRLQMRGLSLQPQAAAARPSSPPSTRGTRGTRNPSPTAVRPSPPHHAPAFQVGHGEAGKGGSGGSTSRIAPKRERVRFADDP